MLRLTTVESTATPHEDAVKMFEYFLASENRQTFFYTGMIASLKHLIKEYENDLDGLKRACEDALREMYLTEYSEADITVATISTDGGELYSIQFKILLKTSDGEKIDVMREYTLDQYLIDNDIYKQELRR